MSQARDEAGNIWETDAQGNPVRLVQQGNQAPANPSYQYEGPKAAADAQRAQAQATVAQAEAPYAGTMAAAQARKAEADARAAEASVRKAELDATAGVDAGKAERAKALGGYQSAMSLNKIIADLEKLYTAGPGSTKGIGGLADFLPTESNKRFDKAANAARGTVGSALGFTGGQLNSVAEAQMNIGPYIPQSGDYDASITDAIDRLKALQAEARDRSIAILGGVPDENGTITPIEKGSAFDQNYLIPGQGAGAAAPGASEQSVPVDPEYQREYGAFLQQWAANPDPQAYVAKRMELDQKFGYDSDVQGYTDWANSTVEQLKQGGTTVDPVVPNMNAPLEGQQQFLNSAINNPFGAAVAGSADALTLGLPSAFAGDKMQALADDSPWNAGAMMLGQVGGSIAGTGAIGKAGSLGLKAITDGVLRNGVKGGPGRNLAAALIGKNGKSQLGRNLATDATYSAGYGGVTEGDPLGGAAVGTIGSAGGQALGKIVGAGIGGMKQAPGVQYLRDRGVDLSIGQKLGGGFRKAEDKMASLPVVGDMVAARQGKSIDDFQKEMFSQGAEYAADNVRGVAEAGVDDFANRVVPNAYNRALGGRTFNITDDFAAANSARLEAAKNLPQSVAGDTEYALNWALDPARVTNGQLSGENMQRVYQDLQRKASKLDGSESASGPDAANILRGALDDLGGMVDQQAPEVMPAFRDANTTYRNFKIIEDAVGKGVNNSGNVMPSQLGLAARQNAKKYGGKFASEDRPFFDLQRAAQDVIPSKVPNSGTFDRAIQAGMGASLLGAGGAAGAYAGGTEGAATGGGLSLGLLALLAAGGTRGGQKALDLALISRPDAMNVAGRAIRNRQGLFGSAAVPLALTYGQ